MLRQARSQPLVKAFEPWLRDKLALVSQKTKIAEAIRYALTRWDGLRRFLDDGRVELDSNVVERAIRPIALNRKNALFAGSIQFVKLCAAEFSLKGRWGFQYANTCSRPRLSAFGGGAHVLDLGTGETVGFIDTDGWLTATVDGGDSDA